MQVEGFLLQGLWSEIALYCGFEVFLVILLSMLFFVAWVLQDWSKIASWNCWVDSFLFFGWIWVCGMGFSLYFVVSSIDGWFGCMNSPFAGISL